MEFPTWLRRALEGPRDLLGRLLGDHERDLDDEIRVHMEMAARDRVARGESRKDAERAVRLEFGEPMRVKEATRRSWGGVWFDRLRQDVRFGARSLGRARSFAAVAVLTLGLGIGITTAVFTVVNGVLLRPLPFSDPDRLVALSVGQPFGEGPMNIMSQDVPLVRDLSSFSLLAAHINYPPVTLTGAGDAVRLNAAFVSADFHRLLGVLPAFGAGFGPEADLEGSAPVVVLGNALWQTRFGADPGIVGRSVAIDRIPYQVVGVMPSGFDFPQGSDLWLPLSASPFTVDNYGLGAVARLADDVSIDQARSELAGFAAGKPNPAVDAVVVPLRDLLVQEARAPLMFFLGAVALVLVISCTNVANLLFMRGSARGRELGLRKALGAARARLVHQLVTESVLLSLAGGIAGLLVAMLGVRWLLSLAPAGTLPRTGEIGLDATVLAFVVGVSSLTGILFGLVPALRSSRRDAAAVIGDASRTHTAGRGRLRGALVTVEIALAVMLLIGAGLLMRSFQELRSVDLGFVPAQALALEVDLPESVYDDPAALIALHENVVEGFRELAGVAAAGATNIEPFGPVFRISSVRVEGLPPTDTGYHDRPVFSTATPDYIRSLGMRLVEGRDFTDADEPGTPLVALVNRSMADRHWPGSSAVGRRFARSSVPGPDQWITVVGVVENVVLEDPATGAEVGESMFWIPMAQADQVYILAHVEYVVRAVAGSRNVAEAMREVVHRVDPNIPATSIATMDEAVLATLGTRLFQMRILTVFALSALLLAGVGIFGVSAYAVNERVREIGIRMALGAEAMRVASATVRGVGLLVFPGMVVGAAFGVAGGRMLSASLYGVVPLDPPTIVGVTLVLGCVAVLASAVPARRATRVDPASLLRSE